MPLPTVAFAWTGDVRTSSRALRQLDALRALELRVTVIGFASDLPIRNAPLGEHVRLHLLPRPPGRGPTFFRRVHHAMRAALHDTPADLYHASDLYVLPACVQTARPRSARVVFDAREIYPHVGATYRKPWARAVWAAVERRYIRHTDAVLTVNETIADYLHARYPIPRPLVLPNVPPRQSVPRTNALRERLGLDADVPVVLYQGGIKPGRGLEPLAAALRAVPEAALVVIGEGPLKAELQRHTTDQRAYFLPHTPPDDLLGLTAGADVGSVLIEPLTRSLAYSLPNKLFEYLMAGVPVLASDLPEIERVVRGHDVGLVVDPSDPEALVDALRRMVSDRAAQARWRANAPAVFETFVPETASHRLTALYRTLLNLPD